MLRLIKKLFIVCTDTIRKKFVFCFIIMISMLISANFYTYFSGRTLNNLYNLALEKNLMLNDFFISLGNTNQLLEEYLRSHSSQTLNEFTDSSSALQKSAAKLEFALNDQNYIRDMVDLQYMIKNYLEESRSSIIFLKKSMFKESEVHHNNAQNIYVMINGNFNSVYSAMIKYVNSIKIQVIDKKKGFYALNGILIALVGILSIIFVQWFSKSLTRPIKKLTEAASRASQGDMSIVDIKISTHDEVSVLALAFNNMIRKINHQLVELKEKVELEHRLKDEEMKNLMIKNLLQKSELKALQSRINPHFLFNSMNMISQMAYIEEAVQTTSLLEAMSEFLRYNLDNFNKVVTIKDEIGNVKDYFYIQRKRFGKRIDFQIIEDEAAYSARIPCLIVQPLVENSIIHGVNSYIDNGIIGVEVKKNSDRVMIRIYDNGIGIATGKLLSLNDLIVNDTNNNDFSRGIGLSNVIARLKLFYKDDLEFKITSNPGVLTEVLLNLPYIDKEDE